MDSPIKSRRYETPISAGQVIVDIPAPGCVVPPEDAEYLIEWFGLILRRLRRDCEVNTQPTTDSDTGSKL